MPRSIRGFATVFTAVFAMTLPAQAAQISWVGTIGFVAEDTGTSVFSGKGIGDPVAATTTFLSACGTGCVADPPEIDEQNFVMAGQPGTVDVGGVVQNVGNANINIQNDHVLDAGELALLSILGVPLPSGTQVDVWTVGSSEDQDLVEFDLAFGSLDTTLFSDLSFVGTPPGASQVDFMVFTLFEQDTQGTVLYEAFGFATLVPEPGVASFAFAGALALALRRRPGRA